MAFSQFKRSAPTATKPASSSWPVELVWGAATAAQRINGEYVKEGRYEVDTATQTLTLSKKRNRDVMIELLNATDQITPEDCEQGRQCLSYLQNDLTLRALKGKLTDFDTAVSRCVAVQDNFDSAIHRYELAVVASLPAAAERAQAREQTDAQIKFATGGLIGQPGDKVQSEVRVLSSVWSPKYNCWYIRGITCNDQPVMFSLRRIVESGSVIAIQGNVKGYRDNLTQLNRVKVL